MLLILFGLGLFGACRPTPRAQPLHIYAASSLAEVMEALSDAFASGRDLDIRLNLASSGTLARQIRAGAPADIYLSANPRWSRYLDSLGLLRPPGLVEVAGNSLVLIAPQDSPVTLAGDPGTWAWRELLQGKRLSMGDPAHVPAGQYGQQALERLGFPQPMEKHLLPAADVRAALMVVELGEAPLGLVYATDARHSAKVRVLATLADSLHAPIRYTAGRCTDTGMAQDYMAFLQSPEAQTIWKAFGFTPPDPLKNIAHELQ
ncbi:molybdate ABC transporter substrate-binding protein [Robiginitalea sp. M366]|uniref:molybdate ABC transporter substrate-binding protein n=1 Tax=Robiginitalea aestuariiviva TaxID=3036903 RepID=UPI00240E913E|nr:molybdate ABC transporter substrate-binding protein [Robiginitalea aestuariiviva]MDG1572313.1 molybdate ABC transporter substrate-binding protein [Robiginitalea aestuariiviva]